MSIEAHVAALKNGTDKAKVMAVFALAWLARHPDNYSPIVEAGAVPPLVELLRSGSDLGKGEAVLALMRRAREGPNTRSMIVDAGAVPLLVEHLRARTACVPPRTAWTTAALANLAMDRDSCLLIADAGAVPLLVENLRCGSDYIKADAARALGNLASSDQSHIRSKVVEAGAVPLLMEILRSGTTDVLFEGAHALAIKYVVVSTLCILKFDCHDHHDSVIDHILEAASLFSVPAFCDLDLDGDLDFASVSEERRAAKARVRELEAENDDLKRKLPAEIRG